MVITENSNFAAEKEVVQTFKNGLNACESSFNGTIKPLQSDMTSITFSTFSDIVGQTIKSRVDYLKDNDFNVIESDITGGSFNGMQKNTDALLNELQVCINSKAKIESAEQEMKDATYQEKVNINQGLSYQTGAQGAVYSYQTKYKQPAYNNAKAKKEEGEREFANGIKYANEYIAKYPTFHFNGTHGESGGESAAATAASGYQYDGKNYEACEGRPVEGDICIITLDDGTQIAAKYVQFDNYSGSRPGQITYLFTDANGKSHRYTTLNGVQKAKSV